MLELSANIKLAFCLFYLLATVLLHLGFSYCFTHFTIIPDLSFSIGTFSYSFANLNFDTV